MSPRLLSNVERKKKENKNVIKYKLSSRVKALHTKGMRESKRKQKLKAKFQKKKTNKQINSQFKGSAV